MSLIITFKIGESVTQQESWSPDPDQPVGILVRKIVDLGKRVLVDKKSRQQLRELQEYL